MPMEGTSSESDQANRPIASMRHLGIFFAIVVTLVVVQWAAGHWLNRDPDAVTSRMAVLRRYLILLGVEWLLVCFVWLGIRKTGTSIGDLVGGSWDRAADVLRDLAIGLTFWLVWSVAVGFVMRSLSVAHPLPKYVLDSMPQTPLEMCMWIVISCSAGFVEELVFRGYLQRQLLALTGRPLLAILGQAVAFGVGHLYQGLVNATVITAMGIMFGLLAGWRKSLRPGMVLHAWTDAFGGLVMFLRR
jgi:membrane protease YdiL (CAAX protease family)